MQAFARYLLTFATLFRDFCSQPGADPAGSGSGFTLSHVYATDEEIEEAARKVAETLYPSRATGPPRVGSCARSGSSYPRSTRRGVEGRLPYSEGDTRAGGRPVPSQVDKLPTLIGGTRARLAVPYGCAPEWRDAPAERKERP